MTTPQQLLLQEQTPRKKHARNSQCERVLALLKSKEWITLPEILDLRIANYRARVSELRQEGFDIECELKVMDGEHHTRYRVRMKR